MTTENVVQIQKNGMAEAIAVNMSKFSPEIMAKLATFGLNEIANNALASAKKNEWDAAERTARVQAKVDSLLAGEWSVRASGGSAMSTLDRIIAAFAYKKAKETIKAKLPDAEIPTSKADFMEASFKTKGGEKTGEAITAQIEGKIRESEANMAHFQKEADQRDAQAKAKREAEAALEEAIAI